VEADNPAHGFPIPRDRIRYFLHLECPYLGGEVIWCCSFHHHVCAGPPLVWHLSAPRVCRQLSWVQETRHGASSQNQQDPTTDP